MRARRETAEAFVLGGFPVLVEYDICPAERDVGIMGDYIEITQLLTLKGMPASFIADRMSGKDWEQLEEELWARVEEVDERI